MGALKSLIARVGLDGADFELGAKKVESVAEKMSHNVEHHFKGALAAAFGVAAIEMATEHVIEYGAQIYDVSKKLAISTEAAQVWDRALKENGASIESGAKFFEKLSASRRTAMEGGAGGAKVTEAFKELGVTIDDLKNKRIEDIAEQIGDVFSAGGDPQALFGALKDVGGKGAGDMVGTLISGVRELHDEFKKLGIIIDDGVIKGLKESEERGKQFGAQLEATLAPVVAGVIRGFQYFFNMLKTDIAYVAGVLYNLSQHPLEFKAAHNAGVEQAKEQWEEIQAEEKALQDKLNKPTKPAVIVENDAAENIKELTRLYERLHQVQEDGRTAGLSKEQKILELKKQQAELQKQMEDKEDGENYAEDDYVKDQIKLQEFTNKIAELEKAPEKKKERGRDHIDSLQRIGGSVGGAAENVLVNLARDQLHALRGIEKNTEKGLKEGNHSTLDLDR